MIAESKSCLFEGSYALFQRLKRVGANSVIPSGQNAPEADDRIFSLCRVLILSHRQPSHDTVSQYFSVQVFDRQSDTLAATGAVLTTKLIHSMKRDGLKRGVVTLCIGGGQGIALAIENLH